MWQFKKNNFFGNAVFSDCKQPRDTISEYRVCKNCLAFASPGQAFCGVCGAKLNAYTKQKRFPVKKFAISAVTALVCSATGHYLIAPSLMPENTTQIQATSLIQNSSYSSAANKTNNEVVSSLSYTTNTLKTSYNGKDYKFKPKGEYIKIGTISEAEAKALYVLDECLMFTMPDGNNPQFVQGLYPVLVANNDMTIYFCEIEKTIDREEVGKTLIEVDYHAFDTVVIENAVPFDLPSYCIVFQNPKGETEVYGIMQSLGGDDEGEYHLTDLTYYGLPRSEKDYPYREIIANRLWEPYYNEIHGEPQTPQSFAVEGYELWDIDRDGTNELVVFAGRGLGEAITMFFTISGSNVYFIGYSDLGEGMLVSLNNLDSGVFCYECYREGITCYQKIEKQGLSIKKGQIIEESAEEMEALKRQGIEPSHIYTGYVPDYIRSFSDLSPFGEYSSSTQQNPIAGSYQVQHPNAKNETMDLINSCFSNLGAVSTKGVALEIPSDTQLYNKPIDMYVSAKGGKSIYLMPKPESGNGNIGTVKHGEHVYILGTDKNGFYYFFLTEDGRFGWNGKKFFSYSPT